MSLEIDVKILFNGASENIKAVFFIGQLFIF
jgi:hypothetical protein